MRDKNTSVKDFRELVSEIGMLITYEATPRSAPHHQDRGDPDLHGGRSRRSPVRRSLSCPSCALASAWSTAFCAWSRPRVGHIGMFRDEETLEPHVYFCKMPKDIAERDIMIVDPMLATGGSADAAIAEMKSAAATASSSWSSSLRPKASSSSPQSTPDVELYCGAVDEKLNGTAISSPASATPATGFSARSKSFP